MYEVIQQPASPKDTAAQAVIGNHRGLVDNK